MLTLKKVKILKIYARFKEEKEGQRSRKKCKCMSKKDRIGQNTKVLRHILCSYKYLRFSWDRFVAGDHISHQHIRTKLNFLNKHNE